MSRPSVPPPPIPPPPIHPPVKFRSTLRALRVLELVFVVGALLPLLSRVIDPVFLKAATVELLGQFSAAALAVVVALLRVTHRRRPAVWLWEDSPLLPRAEAVFGELAPDVGRRLPPAPPNFPEADPPNELHVYVAAMLETRQCPTGTQPTASYKGQPLRRNVYLVSPDHETTQDGKAIIDAVGSFVDQRVDWGEIHRFAHPPREAEGNTPSECALFWIRANVTELCRFIPPRPPNFHPAVYESALAYDAGCKSGRDPEELLLEFWTTYLDHAYAWSDVAFTLALIPADDAPSPFPVSPDLLAFALCLPGQ